MWFKNLSIMDIIRLTILWGFGVIFLVVGIIGIVAFVQDGGYTLLINNQLTSTFQSRLESIYLLLGTSVFCFIIGGGIVAIANIRNKKAQPDPLVVLFNQAQDTAEMGDVDTAKTLLRRILEQDPQFVDAWILYAQLVSPAERPKFLRRALKIDPHNMIARRLLNNKTSKVIHTSSAIGDENGDSVYGMQLSRLYVSWAWRFILLLLIVVCLGTWTFLINTDAFKEYWTLVLQERSIFVDTFSLNVFDFLSVSTILVMGIAFIFIFLYTFFNHITIYQYGIVARTISGTTRMHWGEVTKAEYIDGTFQQKILGIVISSEYKYAVVLTNGKKRISFADDYQQHPDAGRMVVARLSEWTIVNRVSQFSIKPTYAKILDKLN